MRVAREPGDIVPRLDWQGADTLDWAIHQHGILATILGLASVGTWFLLRARKANDMTRNAMTTVCVLLACQGFVGSAQYAMELPPGMVWIHVVLAVATWLALLWAAVAVGRRGARVRAAAARRPRRRRRAPARPVLVLIGPSSGQVLRSISLRPRSPGDAQCPVQLRSRFQHLRLYTGDDGRRIHRRVVVHPPLGWRCGTAAPRCAHHAHGRGAGTPLRARSRHCRHRRRVDRRGLLSGRLDVCLSGGHT